MKKTKRKGFNFFRSYYDVYNELEKDEDKIAFIDALLDKQFLGINPEGLKGLARFAWISQVNSIDSQVKGYEDKTGVKLSPEEKIRVKTTPTEGGDVTPTEQVQVQVEGKEKGEVQVEEQDVKAKNKFLPPSFDEFKEYALGKIQDIDLEKLELKFESWKVAGWKTGKGTKIKNWKSTLLNTLPYLKKEKSSGKKERFRLSMDDLKVENLKLD